ncbi:hypothetical protein TGARI_371140 [Toxoplasma gondii ARI]|uniref:Uncharacterized protein n=1 Tax=Toxoplasma gondii ARI TaxID=1074872 RepID=A0A139XQP6_TOXGO|nr:hypothetical protein TGARI_371140 [Toxoplasma gondii ARI]
MHEVSPLHWLVEETEPRCFSGASLVLRRPPRKLRDKTALGLNALRRFVNHCKPPERRLLHEPERAFPVQRPVLRRGLLLPGRPTCQGPLGPGRPRLGPRAATGPLGATGVGRGALAAVPGEKQNRPAPGHLLWVLGRGRRRWRSRGLQVLLRGLFGRRAEAREAAGAA